MKKYILSFLLFTFLVNCDSGGSGSETETETVVPEENPVTESNTAPTFADQTFFVTENPEIGTPIGVIMLGMVLWKFLNRQKPKYRHIGELVPRHSIHGSLLPELPFLGPSEILKSLTT